MKNHAAVQHGNKVKKSMNSKGIQKMPAIEGCIGSSLIAGESISKMAPETCDGKTIARKTSPQHHAECVLCGGHGMVLFKNCLVCEDCIDYVKSTYDA